MEAKLSLNCLVVHHRRDQRRTQCNACQLPTLNCSFSYSWRSVHWTRCLDFQVREVRNQVTWRVSAGDPPTSVPTGAVARHILERLSVVDNPLSDTAISRLLSSPAYSQVLATDPSHHLLVFQPSRHHDTTTTTTTPVVDKLQDTASASIGCRDRIAGPTDRRRHQLSPTITAGASHRCVARDL